MSCKSILRIAVALSVMTAVCFSVLFFFRSDFAIIDRILMFASGFGGLLLTFFVFEAWFDARPTPMLNEVNHDQEMEPVD